MLIPGTGTLLLMHVQTGEDGFLVSLPLGESLLPIGISPIEIGIRQLQQISVIGFTKCPLHVTSANT
jgi:hypothetical protein